MLHSTSRSDSVHRRAPLPQLNLVITTPSIHSFATIGFSPQSIFAPGLDICHKTMRALRKRNHQNQSSRNLHQIVTRLVHSQRYPCQAIPVSSKSAPCSQKMPRTQESDYCHRQNAAHHNLQYAQEE